MNAEPLFSAVNGSSEAGVDCRDRGLAYGDGLFETVLVVDGDLPLWPRHRTRLLAGCARLGLAPDLVALEREIETALTRAPAGARAVLKLIITRGVGWRGYRPQQPHSATRIVQLGRWHPTPAANDPAREGIRVRLASTRLASQPALAGLKHLNRLEQVLASAEAPAAAGEALCMDTAGLLIEGTASNLFLVIDGELHTPDIVRCGVAGVMRGLILEDVAPSLGLKSRILDLPLPRLYVADEVFLCNSLHGVRPVVAVGCHQKHIGETTRSVARAVAERCHV